MFLWGRNTGADMDRGQVSFTSFPLHETKHIVVPSQQSDQLFPLVLWDVLELLAKIMVNAIKDKATLYTSITRDFF